MYHVPCTLYFVYHISYIWYALYHVPCTCSSARGTLSYILHVAQMHSNTDAVQCMHWFLYSTTGFNWLAGWSSAAPRRHAGGVSVAPVAVVARPTKRQRLEADRRRDVLRVVGNQFADIDFTRYQYLPEAGTAGPGRGRIVPVKPVPTALVENWRHLESYECDGDTSYSEDQFTMLQMRSGHHRRHWGWSPTLG